MEQIILKLIDKLPQSFIILSCVIYTIHKICLSDKGTFNKIVRYLDKSFKKSSEETRQHFKIIEDKIDKNTKAIQELKENDKKQDEIINKIHII